MADRIPKVLVGFVKDNTPPVKAHFTEVNSIQAIF